MESGVNSLTGQGKPAKLQALDAMPWPAPRTEREDSVKAIIAFLVLLAPVAAQGQLLKCIGKDGGIEYALQCPPGTQEQQTGIKSTREGPSSSGATSPQQKSIAEREAEFRKRQMEAQEALQKAEKKAAEDTADRANCAQAQTYLKSLQEGQRISQVDPKTGERVFVEDYARPAEIAKAQQAADSWCK